MVFNCPLSGHECEMSPEECSSINEPLVGAIPAIAEELEDSGNPTTEAVIVAALGDNIKASAVALKINPNALYHRRVGDDVQICPFEVFVSLTPSAGNLIVWHGLRSIMAETVQDTIFDLDGRGEASRVDMDPYDVYDPRARFDIEVTD